MQNKELDFTPFAVRQRAVTMQRLTNTSARLFMERAEFVEQLVAGMRCGEASFTIIDEMGYRRKTRGTLRGYERVFRRAYRPLPENQFILYFDLCAEAWRTVNVIHVFSNLHK
jgi:hypothetical protein